MATWLALTALLAGCDGRRPDTGAVVVSAIGEPPHVADVRRSAESHGFPWAFWNLFDGMGMMDDASRALDPAMVSALGLTTTP